MKIRNIIFIFTGLVALSSCEDMFVPTDENTRQEDAMYVESDYAHGLLLYAYDRLPYQTTTQTDVATDDAVTNVKSSNLLNIATGAWASDNNPSELNRWDACKDGIQYVNKFLQIVDKVSWAPSAVSRQQMFVDRLKGEALGLRAIFYYHLLQAHGGYAEDGELYGVPLLTEPEDGSSDYNQPRATFAACVQQIYNDCDMAAQLLPDDYADISEDSKIPEKYTALGAQKTGYNLVFGDKSFGFVSAKVAKAVKAQTALLAASPAFRDKSGVTSEEAAKLSAVVLQSIGGLSGFDATGNIWYKNTNKLKDAASEMPEILWREERHNNAAQELDNFPPTLYGNGKVNPSQNLVDAFPMRSGRPITDPASGYDEQNPYANRDPRLADNVLYNGQKFRSRIIITGTYPAVNGEVSETDDNINSISTSTRTGYYLKKLLREDVSPLSSSLITQNHIYPRIRFTELFLAYAEAANDAWGPNADPEGIGYTAYDVIKAIRTRAGIAINEFGLPMAGGDSYLEECAADKNKMTELIRNERRIELCFENKRFWDLRRWLKPLNDTVWGMRVDLDKVKDDGSLIYTPIEVETRNFNESYMYYGPIPKTEVLKWSNLMQNKGW